MRFGVLGPLQVRSATGDDVTVSGPRPRALLVLLLLNAGRVVGVDQLIAGQYGDDPPANAANALQAQVSRLRRDLGSDLVEFHGTGYLLAVDPDDVDVHRFERLAREGHRLLATGAHDKAATVLRDALALWRGPALTDLPHATAQAARLDDERLAATEDLVEAELALPAGADVAELQRLVADHPLRERLRSQLMRALRATGRQADALATYDEARGLLADELGVDPSPELAATHLAILRAEPPVQPTRRKPAAQLTSFVGRDAELSWLAERSDVRLVTITGPGGTGKTRLGIEAARRAGRDTCFADLAPVDDADQLPAAILYALGVRETSFQATPTDPLPRLVAALDQDLLLVVDNCEHLTAATAALLRTLLADCPRLHVLATSREPLGLTGEVLLPLAPLSTDNAGQLFADRAGAVRPGITLDSAQVAGICTTLDSLPLAIELAAARLRQFDLAELATRLAEHGRFRLLNRGDPTAATRHQTLTAAVEWSWDLLTPGEQELATRFTVFTGGAPLQAVDAVCEVEDADLLLADLVDKSIVTTDGTRYRMLETIRLFCAARLPADDVTGLRGAHARYHLSLAQQADPHLRRAEQLDWLARLSAEHDNLLAALRFAVTGDRETAFGLVAALSAYLWLSGRHSQVGAASAGLLEGEPPPGLEEEYVACVVHAVPRAAPEHWERAATIIGGLGRALRYPFGAARWGMAAGPADTDTDSLLGSDPWNAALGRLSTGLLNVLGGQPVAGERELLGVLASFEELGERWGIAQCADFLAQVASWRGEWRRAEALWTNALTAFDELGALDESADLLCHRADSRLRQGRVDAAEADYERAAELSATAGNRRTPQVLLGLADVARARGDLAARRELLAEALAVAGSGEFRFATWKAVALTALGRHDEAIAIVRDAPLAVDLAAATEGLAGAVLERGAGEGAALLLGAAVALRGTAVAGATRAAEIAAGARDLIGAGPFAAAYAHGAALTRDEALTIIDGHLR